MGKNMLKTPKTIDCFAKGSYPALQGDKKGMNPEINTLPKQHTSSFQGGVVDSSPKARLTGTSKTCIAILITRPEQLC